MFFLGAGSLLQDSQPPPQPVLFPINTLRQKICHFSLTGSIRVSTSYWGPCGWFANLASVVATMLQFLRQVSQSRRVFVFLPIPLIPSLIAPLMNISYTIITT